MEEDEERVCPSGMESAKPAARSDPMSSYVFGRLWRERTVREDAKTKAWLGFVAEFVEVFVVVVVTRAFQSSRSGRGDDFRAWAALFVGRASDETRLFAVLVRGVRWRDMLVVRMDITGNGERGSWWDAGAVAGQLTPSRMM